MSTKLNVRTFYPTESVATRSDTSGLSSVRKGERMDALHRLQITSSHTVTSSPSTIGFNSWLHWGLSKAIMQKLLSVTPTVYK